MNLTIIKSAVLIVFLFTSGIFDIKKKSIPLPLIVGGGIVLLFLSLLDHNMNWMVSILGAVLGAVLLLLSKILRGAIGVGDGLVVLLVGFVMGIYGGCVVLFYSLFLASLFSIVMLCLKKLKKKDSIPFIPFLFISYLGVFLG